MAVTIAEYTHALLPALPLPGRAIALLVLLAFALLQCFGLEAGSVSQKLLTIAKALGFLGLIAACFLLAPPGALGPALTQEPPPQGLALAAAFVFALQAVITTYDGWHSPIYFAEEFADPAAALPRSLVGGVLAVGASTCW